MAILSGSISYLRFSVLGEVPNSIAEYFEKVLAIRRFVPLHEAGRDMESSGWVSILNPYMDEERILNDQFLFGHLVVLGFREDRVRYPKQMFKDWVAKRLQESPGKNRQAVESAVMSELRQRFLPASKVIEALWDMSKQELRLFARGQGILERFQKLFEQTFPMKLELLEYVDEGVKSSVIGPEFLTWLCFEPNLELILGRRISLKPLEGEERQVVIKSPNLDQSRELAQAIRSGYLVESVALEWLRGERIHSFTLNALDGSISAVKTNAPEKTTGETESDILLRMSNLDEIEACLAQLFQRFKIARKKNPSFEFKINIEKGPWTTSPEA